jgi:hypothetical protein
MKAHVGDRIHVPGKSVGRPDQRGQITEIRGADGAPPYVVHFADGHTSLVYPGPDCVIEHAVDA